MVAMHKFTDTIFYSQNNKKLRRRGEDTCLWPRRRLEPTAPRHGSTRARWRQPAQCRTCTAYRSPFSTSVHRSARARRLQPQLRSSRHRGRDWLGRGEEVVGAAWTTSAPRSSSTWWERTELKDMISRGQLVKEVAAERLHHTAVTEPTEARRIQRGLWGRLPVAGVGEGIRVRVRHDAGGAGFTEPVWPNPFVWVWLVGLGDFPSILNQKILENLENSYQFHFWS
jgi:hypothetical protein